MLAVWMQVEGFLPEVGLAWVDKEGSTTYLSYIRDNRECMLFADFLEGVATETEIVMFVERSKSLNMVLDEIVCARGPKLKVVPVAPMLPSTPPRHTELHPEVCQKAAGLLRQECSVPFTDCCAFVARLSSRWTTVTTDNLTAFGALNSAACAGLPSSPSTSSMSLQTFFSRQSSAMGKRRFTSHFLHHPLLQVREHPHFPYTIETRQKVVDALRKDPMLATLIAQKISTLVDLDKAAIRAVNASRIPPQQQRNMVPLIQKVHAAISQVASINGAVNKIYPYLDASLRACYPLYTLIDKVFDLSPDSSRLLNASISIPQLADTYQTLKDIETAMDRELEAYNRRLNGKVKMVEMQPHGKVFRIPKTLDVPKETVLIRLNKAEKIFTSKNLQKLNDKLAEALEACSHFELSVINKTLQVLESYVSPLNQLADLIGEIDILVSIASTLSILPFGSEAHWILPTFATDDETVIEVLGGRHPLLALRSELGLKNEVVANDFCCSKSASHIVITGPNMGGKSTYARQQALLCLMSCYGMPVPATKMLLKPILVFWARLGASDNPFQNCSTFMVEAKETAAMINAVDNAHIAACMREHGHELLLGILVMDEMGRGTSVKDGFQFAKAIEQHLQTSFNDGSVTSISATHFHGLAHLSNIKPLRMGKLHTQERFKAIPGIEEDSDGINLARSVQFPQEIIDEAQRMINTGVINIT